MRYRNSSILLTILFTLALLLHPNRAISQTTTPPPRTPETVEEGYQTLVPESVQTARKDQEFAGQVQNLHNELQQIQSKIPDKALVETLRKQVDQIIQYDAVLRQAIVSLQIEVRKIDTLLDSYGQGYEAAKAAALAQRKQQKQIPVIKPQPTDPLNP
jgi:hypothetical protein